MRQRGGQGTTTGGRCAPLHFSIYFFCFLLLTIVFQRDRTRTRTATNEQDRAGAERGARGICEVRPLSVCLFLFFSLLFFSFLFFFILFFTIYSLPAPNATARDGERVHYRERTRTRTTADKRERDPLLN